MKQTSNVREVVFVLSLGMTRWLKGNLEACEKELAPIPFLRRTYSGQEESKEESSCQEESSRKEEGCQEEGSCQEEGCSQEEEEVASVFATGRPSGRYPGLQRERAADFGGSSFAHLGYVPMALSRPKYAIS